jgi:predicted nucleic acid-binding protein
MPRFMLDTDTCSYIMKRSHPLVLRRLQSVPVGDVCMSVVSTAELLYGVEVSPRRAQDEARWRHSYRTWRSSRSMMTRRFTALRSAPT